jgi:hypothetical protein
MATETDTATAEETAIRLFLGTSEKMACGATNLTRQIMRVSDGLNQEVLARTVRELVRAGIIKKRQNGANSFLYKLA